MVATNVQLPVRHRDGHLFAVELAAWATRQPSGWTLNAFVRDATERSQRDEALHRLASIVDASDDAVIGLTTEDTISSWNWAAEQMYGYSAAEAVGQSVWLFVPPARHDEMRAWLDIVRSGERVRYRETVRVTRSGSLLEIAESISPIHDVGGVVVGASVVDRDTTERRWMASTLDAALEKLQVALGEAQASEARSRRFLADAAHQLRTPVTGIRACAENLLHGGEESEQDRLLADLVRETARASRLVTALLRVARLDEGEPLDPVPTNMVAVCADEVDRSWSLAPHLDFGLRAEELPVSEPNLDANVVREIVANVLDNARRHALGRVEVVVRAAGNGIEVVIWDDGPGVPPGMEERIFERFVSIGDTGGSGLGLAIAQELARAHGGELSYGSAGFVLWLPAGTAPESGEAG